MTPTSIAVPAGPAGLLLSRDLIFTTKILGTAQALGLKVVSAGTGALVSAMLAQWRPVAIFIDLSASDLVAPSALVRFRAECPGIPLIAFGSHVDADVLRAAREAGCDEVMPRSWFASELPELLRRYVSPDHGPESSIIGRQ